MPKITRTQELMTLSLRVTRRTTLGDRFLEPGDILDADPVDGSVVLAVRLPWNAGQLAGAIADGDLVPMETTPAAARLVLLPSLPAPVPGVLAFRRRGA